MRGPLAGVRVVELARILAGPWAGQTLADLGADVIKVERPDGDNLRQYPSTLERESRAFLGVNRSKQGIALDLKQAADHEVFDKLIAEADVYIQNFRPGVAERLGVGAERLRGLNPRLVYAAISGFGNDGPHKDRPAFDTVAQASAGFLRLLVNPGNPRVVGPAIADALTGFYTAYGILAALYEREQTGRGRTVETSMFEAMCHFNLDDFTHLFSEGLVMDAWSRPHVSQSYVFECADGGWIALHMSSPPKFWENLAKLLLAEVLPPDLAQTLFHGKKRGFNPPLRHWLQHDLAERYPGLGERLAGLEVPHSPVFNSAEVAEGELAAHHGLVLETEGPHGPFRTIRSPIRFDGERQTEVTAPPVLGADNERVLGRKG